MKYTVPMGAAHLIATPPIGGPIPSAPRSPLRKPDAGRRDPSRSERTDARRGPAPQKHRGTLSWKTCGCLDVNQPLANGVHYEP